MPTHLYHEELVVHVQRVYNDNVLRVEVCRQLTPVPNYLRLEGLLELVCICSCPDNVDIF